MWDRDRALSWLDARASPTSKKTVRLARSRPDLSLSEAHGLSLSDDRSAGGRFYTPPALAERLVDRCLAPLLDGREFDVLDPACGGGALLDIALQRMITALRPRFGPEAAHVALRHIHGRDEDGEVLDVAAAQLSASTGLSPDLVRSRLDCANSLSAPPRRTRNGGFDAIVANPPWVSWSGRQAAASRPDARTERRFPASRRWPSAHGMFTALCARSLNREGRAALLLPAGMAWQPSQAPLREEMSRFFRVESPVTELAEDAFPGVTQPAILAVVVRSPRSEASSRAWTLPSASGGQPAWESEAQAGLPTMPRFPPRTFFDPGVHTGNMAKKLVRDGPPPGPEYAPIREGRDISAFRLGPPRRCLWVDAHPAEGEYCRIGRKERFAEALILVRQTAARPVAARHTAPGYFRNSALGARRVPGWPTEALLALLNSETYRWLFALGSRDVRQRSFPQVKVGALQRLPLPPEGPWIEPLAEWGRRLEADASPSPEALERTVITALGLPPEALASILRS